MKVTSITVSYSRTFSLEYYGGPRYESIKPETSITAELEDSDDPDAVIVELQALAKGSVKEQATAVLVHYRQKVNDIRAGLPADLES